MRLPILCSQNFSAPVRGLGRVKTTSNRNEAIHQGKLIEEEQGLRCPSCEVLYICSGSSKAREIGSFLKGYRISSVDNVLGHSRKLLRASGDLYESPISKLFCALSKAEKYIHFVSYGIHDQVIGVLKAAKFRGVRVRGVVSNVNHWTANELKDTNKEMPYGWEINTYDSGTNYEEYPHQKVVIIDGLIAFKGSANLTMNGLRKAARGRDDFERVTNINKVIELNNRLFSSVWRSSEYEKDEIIDIDSIDVF
ncbi:phosphatidylserine/phosphatidylglycerophosphate/cardiolipin synthase family protein [Halomicronema sp. CCY15110]|uniref:phospholipase D-like domain-containing protein n=1 Tax=Halomicronema sp. CCY15110 TaxID=2767773 RepID=UPI00194EF89A|nr:phospholipase D family protein [Halomicronema sp. CCY15110]